MLKLMRISRCSLCTRAVLKTTSNNDDSNTVSNLEKLRLRYIKESRNAEIPRGSKAKMVQKPKCEDPKAVLAILKKYGIDKTPLTNKERDLVLLTETPYEIEKRILLLQELRASNITTCVLANFINSMYLPVRLFKANLHIEPEVNLARCLFSSIETNIDISDLENLDEKMEMKKYFSICFVRYMRNELNLTDYQAKKIGFKRGRPGIYNSFSLLSKMLSFLKEDLKFSTKLIIRDYWLLSQHYEETKKMYEITKEGFKEDALSLVTRYPKLLDFDEQDLKAYISAFEEFEITPKMLKKCVQIFHFDSAEFRKRVLGLLEDPFTAVFYKHPSFLSLVRFYYVAQARVQYLKEKNIKYATIHSLTVYSNIMERLVTVKKMNRVNLRCFFQSQFGEGAEELLITFKKHHYHQCVPLLPLYESLAYLKEHFPEEVIRNQIFTILYNKSDLQTAHEIVLKDPTHSKLPPHQLLAMCVYKIEEKYGYTGEAVLHPEKYAESVRDESRNEEIVKNESG